MPSSRPWVRLEDIIENALAVLEYTQGMSHDDYLADRKTVDACERCLSRISEAAVKLGPFAEERLPDHNWIGIRNLGNILRHEYDQIEAPTIWDVITIHLPPLIDDLQFVLATQRPTES